jgi:hypothetical protein
MGQIQAHKTLEDLNHSVDTSLKPVYVVLMSSRHLNLYHLQMQTQ